MWARGSPSWIKSRVGKLVILHADEALSWNDLHARYDMKRIDHQVAYSLNGACTNAAVSYFSRLRRAEMGHHHHVSGPYLVRYAQERCATPRRARGVRTTAACQTGLR